MRYSATVWRTGADLRRLGAPGRENRKTRLVGADWLDSGALRGIGLGRELFNVFRANAAGAEQGAMTYTVSDHPGPHVSPRRAALSDHRLLARAGAA